MKCGLSEVTPRAAGVTLVDLAAPSVDIDLPSSLVRLFELGSGVFSIEIAAASDSEPSTLVGSLLECDCASLAGKPHSKSC